MRTIYFILIALTMQSCFSTIMDDDFQSIDPELRPYFKSFMVEAAERGYQLDTTILKLNFGDLGPDVQGRTFIATHQIIINKESIGWRKCPEGLVFHELGHLYLGREHREGIINRKQISIMAAVDGDPTFSGEKSYRRKYYVDELFNPTTPIAYWFYIPG